MRPRKRASVNELSLVPLADMLTNTVGIVLFILIFTVITAGGVVLLRELPLERPSQTKPLFFLCFQGRLLPFSNEVVDKFMEQVGKPRSFADLNSWTQKFNGQSMEDEFFILSGEGKELADLAIAITPREGVGETATALQNPDSQFRQLLRANNPKEKSLQFLVYDNSVEVFFAAREAAAKEANYGIGWYPHDNKPLRIHLLGGGGGDLTTQTGSLGSK